MRRHFKMAFGSWVAVTAAALGQTPAQQPAQQQTPVQQVRYATPFANANGQTQQVQYVAVQPQQTANGAAQSPITVQYVPVQVMPNGQYVAVQPTSNMVPVQATSTSGYLPMQPATSGMMLPNSTVEPQISSNNMIPAQMPATMSTAAPTQTTVQYVPLQPMSATPQSGGMTSTPAIQYVPIQAVAPQRPATVAQQPATAVPGPGCTNGNCATGTCPSGACDAPTCNTCCQGPCGPCGHVWVSAEYLLWWTQGFYVPPLITASPAGTPNAQAAVLGQPGTTILFGDELLNNGLRSGFRLRAGAWLDDCQRCGIEASYFWLGDAGDGYSAGPSSTQIIGRPFYNANLPGTPPDAQHTNVPNDVSGNTQVDSNTAFSGGDVNLIKNCKCDCCGRLDVLVGFRYLRLEDDLTISEDLTVTGPASGIPIGTRFQIFDNFHTLNEFYGAQVGVSGEQRRGQYFVNYRALVGFGTTHKTVTINGQTTITPPGGAAQTYPGGIYALPTNMGTYDKNDFAVVPEFGLNLGYQASQNLRVFVGYSFLYWSNVTRPGDTMDVVINPTQFPPGTLVGSARPAFAWQDSDFWAQGVSFGAELRW